jgi:hypothetical protein
VRIHTDPHGPYRPPHIHLQAYGSMQVPEPNFKIVFNIVGIAMYIDRSLCFALLCFALLCFALLLIKAV